MEALWEEVQKFFTTSGWTIVSFLATLVFGIIVIQILSRVIRTVLFKSTINKTLCGFVTSIIKFLLYMVLIFILADIAGISMTPLVTALGAAGLAISLALQDSLSNIANGVLIIGTKPFKVGDFVEIDGISGTVKAIRMITIELLTPDNKKITLPNSKVISGSIINYSARPTRRIEFSVPARYDSDVDKVKRVLLKELDGHPLIKTEPSPTAVLHRYKDRYLEFLVRGWVNNEDYWDVYWELNERLYIALRENDVEIPHDEMKIRMDEKTTGGDGK